MKAIVCTQYGPPEVLQVADLPKPVPKKNEILIHIRATAVNSGDVRVRGLLVDGFLKYVMMLVLGIRKPRKPILGTVFSGVVVDVGKDVSRFQVGDEVYGSSGFQFGCYTEFIALKEKSTVELKPKNASFEEAAALIFGGQTALYFLEKSGLTNSPQPKILIYGASGSVGTAAIQVAKLQGAHVTAVCSTANEKLVKEVGADEVWCYDQIEISKQSGKFDLIFDAVGKVNKKMCGHLLAEKGGFKTVGGLDVADETSAQLLQLKSWYENGQYQAAIDRTYELNDIVAAHRYVETGRKKGNVVIRMSSI